MKKKFIVLASSVLVVALLFVFSAHEAYASCKCVRENGGTGAELDNTGVVIPVEGYGLWTTVGDDPSCPDPAAQNPALDTPHCYETATGPIAEGCDCNAYTQGFVDTWFRVPTLGDLVGNVIRLMFFIAGLYALVLLLLGGFEWVSSGGDDKKLSAARGKIINAIIGLVVMVAVLTLVILLEQVVFGGKVCLGISCPINMGDLRIIR